MVDIRRLEMVKELSSLVDAVRVWLLLIYAEMTRALGGWIRRIAVNRRMRKELGWNNYLGVYFSLLIISSNFTRQKFKRCLCSYC